MKKRNSFVYLLLAGVCLLVMAAAIAFIIKYYADNRREEAVYESLQSAAAGLPTSPLGPQAEAEPSPAPQAFGPPLIRRYPPPIWHRPVPGRISLMTRLFCALWISLRSRRKPTPTFTPGSPFRAPGLTIPCCSIHRTTPTT